MLRECIVDNKDALFHGWFEVRQMVSAGLSIMDDHPGGVIADVVGIVEFMDGTVVKVFPDQIRFKDTAMYKAAQVVVDKLSESDLQKLQANISTLGAVKMV